MTARGKLKVSGEVAVGLSFIWTVAQWGWRLIGDWQQVDQVVAEWPAFIRWLGRPETGPVIFAVAVVVYLVAVFWPTPTEDPLVGKFFHTYTNGGVIQYQGHVIREQGGRYFIQLYSFDSGEPTNQRFMTDAELQTARFYETDEQWREAYERATPRVRGL